MCNDFISIFQVNRLGILTNPLESSGILTHLHNLTRRDDKQIFSQNMKQQGLVYGHYKLDE